jgi:hypothetical protein
MLARRALPALLALLACGRSSPPASPPAPPPQAAPAPEPAAPPAEAEPAPQAAAAPVREAAALQPGGVVAALAAEGETRIDPSATFRLALSGPSHDARLTLLDASNAAVPAIAKGEIGEDTVLTLEPSVPLAPGGRYQLRLDGAVTRDFHLGEQGHAPVAYALKVIGEPSPPPKAARPAHRGKKR